MIYLIGGPPKCGKTTLAKTLSKSFSIPWISADTLQNIVYAYMPEDERNKFFPHKYLKGATTDETYAKNSATEIINGYIAQGRTSYKAISMLAETQIIDEDDYIVEGYQVTPEIVAEIIKKFGAEKVRTIFLVKHDAEKFVENIHKSTTPNDWIVRNTKDKAVFLKIAAMISEYSQYFEAEAEKFGFPALNMDDDFEKQIENAIALLREGAESEQLVIKPR